MQFRLQDSLGFIDAGRCNKDFGCSLAIEKSALMAGEVVELTDKAAAFLKSKYPALLKPANVKGEAKEAEIKAPAK